MLEPLIEACRLPVNMPLWHLRRTISEIPWQHANCAKRRIVPDELGAWWAAEQNFIRWSQLGVWERLLTLAQQQSGQLGMTFLDGSNIRSHQKAAGAKKSGHCGIMRHP